MTLLELRAGLLVLSIISQISGAFFAWKTEQLKLALWLVVIGTVLALASTYLWLTQ